MKKLLFLICACFSFIANAGPVEEKKLNFNIDVTKLGNDIHYSFGIFGKDDFAYAYPELAELDLNKLFDQKNIKIMFYKSAMIVNQPASLFEAETLGDEKFVQFLLSKDSVKKQPNGNFEVRVPGALGYSYNLQVIHDADDLSSLENSKNARTITLSKAFDPISLGSSSSVIRLLTNFSKYTVSGMAVSHHIPVDLKRTLIITYSISGVKSMFALPKMIKPDLLQTIEGDFNQLNKFTKKSK
jgi:hypothetical protein